MNTSNKYRSPLAFLGFKVTEMSFKLNDRSEGGRFPLDFDVDAKFDYAENDVENTCQVTLKATFFKTLAERGEDYPFNLDLTMVGYFSSQHSELGYDKFKTLVEKNGVAILFPYLRSIVCDASKMANISPILLPSMNIAKFIEDKQSGGM